MLDDFLRANLKPKQLAKLKNNLELYIQYSKLINLCLSQFEYENLPESCDPWFLELALLDGMALIGKDPNYGVVSVKATYGGMLNIYGYPLEVYGYGINGYNKKFTPYIIGGENSNSDCAIGFDNPARTRMLDVLFAYALRISDCIRTIDVATKKLKNPYFINAPKEQVESIKAIIRQADNNEELIIPSTTLTADSFKVIPTSVDAGILKQLIETYSNMYDMIKEILGIKNIGSSQKRERLITDEAEGTDMLTDINLQLRLSEREKMCEQANAVLGSQIKVKLKDPYKLFDELVNEQFDPKTEELSTNREESEETNGEDNI